MAAKAVAFKEAATFEFQQYAKQVIANSKTLAEVFVKKGAKVLTGGSDNHLFVIDVAQSFGLNGRQAENLLRSAKLTVNRNSIPNDVNGAWYTSGVRMGTPAITTLGMKEAEMEEIGTVAFDLLKAAKPEFDEKRGRESKVKAKVSEEILSQAKIRIDALLKEFPLYPELVI